MFDKNDINNPLEEIKVEQALRSEMMKLEYRKKNNPSKINILDYTVIKALEFVLNESNRKTAQKPIYLINDKDIKIGNITFKKGTRGYKCPACNDFIGYRHKYCHECGKAILWED